MPNTVDLFSKVQQSNLYFANLMDKYVDSFVYSMDRDEKINLKVNELYEVLEAIQYQMSKGLYYENEVTRLLYEKIDCLTPIYDTTIVVDSSLINPIIFNMSVIYGPPGQAGPGVAIGGTTGQFLVKKSDTNYDTEWIDLDVHDEVTLGTANGLSLIGQQLSLGLSSADTNGALSFEDWIEFYGKQNTITLTTTGTSGAATLIGDVLNIPTYTLVGLGGQPLSDSLTSISGLTGTTGLLRKTAANTFVLDTSSYLTGITSSQVTTALGFTPYNASNPAGYITSAALSGYVPTSRELTINGTTYDLSANRSWTVSANTEPLEFDVINRTVWNTGKGSTSGSTSFGSNALASSSGIAMFNTGFGINALYENTDGQFNVGIGSSVMGFSGVATPLNRNTGVGHGAIYAIRNSNDNVAVGYLSGTDGTTNLTSINNSVFIGSETRPLANTQTNQIVIGYNAIGAGSNTATLGNTDIVLTRLRGEVQGGSFVKDGGLATEFLKADGSVDSNTYITSTDLSDYVPKTRTITINGETQDLSADQEWTINAGGTGVRTPYTFIATAGQTTFTTVGYTVGQIDVYYNGSKQLPSEYVATNGTTVVFPTGKIAGDEIEIVIWTISDITSGDSFEYFSKNLKSYPYALNYTGTVLNSIVYTLPGGTITKTFSYTGTTLSSIALSGAVPTTILTTKTFTYTGTQLTSVVYS
jgi:hypothetical protein